jgi:beta-glucosidase
MLLPIAAVAEKLPYKNPKLSPEERTRDLISRMTLDEKIAQMQCEWLMGKVRVMTNGKFDEAKAAGRWGNGIGELARLNEDLSITRREQFGQTLPPRKGAELYNQIQKYFVEKTRLGIPVVSHEECLHGQQSKDATNFPVPIALASSWDEELIHQIYTAVAKEVRSRGGSHVLGPVLDVVRDPRWGRTEETMGEDTYYNSRMGKAIVKSLQGTKYLIDDEHVGVTLKHFGVHGNSEGGVNTAPSYMDEHEARQTFLLPFRDVIHECDPMYVMVTYNELWGQPAHANSYLLQNILRDEFGFKGTIVSDYSGISNIHAVDKSVPDYDEAGIRGLMAGVEMELPDILSYKNLKTLVAEGRISEQAIDKAVTHILLNKFRLGLFDRPYVNPAKAEQIVGCEAHRKLAYQAAAESMVLLKNGNRLLPLDKDKVKSIALIGPNANRCILGGYSDVPRDTITPLRAIREKYGDKMNILYAEGVRLTHSNDNSHPNVRLLTEEENRQRIREAVKTAEKADVIVLFLGENEAMSREATTAETLGDLPTLDLLAGQKQLIDEIVALGKPVCAFVNSGTTLSLGYLEQKVPAVMQCWYLGQEGGYAMIDALFGDVNPSGKLTISFPRSAGHIPSYYNYKPSSRRGYNLGFDISPLHPFGYGLSYTTYRYSNPRIDRQQMAAGDTAVVSIDVENMGSRDGSEIVQMYVTDDYATMTRPVKELRGFKRVHLNPGEKQTVSFRIDKDLLSYYDRNNHWQCEPGTFTIAVGASSEDNQKVKLEIK